MTSPDTPLDEKINAKLALHFNGINARSGGYLFEPISAKELAKVATGQTLDSSHLAELKFRHTQKDASHYGVKAGIDAAQLDQAGWGVIFPAAAPGSPEARLHEAIYEALSPLLSLRRAQAGRVHAHYYKEYRGAEGYRPGESKQKFLARLGTGPGPADPDKVPYYLLLVGSPQDIPFHIQYQIDVQYAVGRIHFDTIEEYDNYARSVVAAETGGLALTRELALVGVHNPDDLATQLGRQHLAAPLADLAAGKFSDWKVSRYFDEQASKASVAGLFGGPQTPALLFSSSHGMGFDKGDPLQRRHQGALLLQDWPGPKQWRRAIGEDFYLSGDDLRSDAGMLGSIVFNFACYGGGTPQFDEFSKQAFKRREEIAEAAFVAGLHQRMLGHPKGGALAAIGHVERAWGYSFLWGTGKRGATEPQLAAFESTLETLMAGKPVGLALEYFNERYAELASDLSVAIEELEYNPDAVDDFTLANMWTSSNDARGYAITGDPAVRLSLDAGEGQEPRSRERIELSSATTTTSMISGEASEPDEPAPGAVNFALFGRDKAESEPGLVEGFISKMLGTLGGIVEDAMTLEVRTFVSDEPGKAAAAGRDGLAGQAELRAYTRMQLDGDTDVIVPQRDGQLDAELWRLHVEMVAQAHAARAELLQTVVSTVSGLIKR